MKESIKDSVKNEKKIEKILDALDYLDEDMIEEVEGLKKIHQGQRKSVRTWRHFVALAASIGVLITGYWLVNEVQLLDIGNIHPETSPNGAFTESSGFPEQDAQQNGTVPEGEVGGESLEGDDQVDKDAITESEEIRENVYGEGSINMDAIAKRMQDMLEEVKTAIRKRFDLPIVIEDVDCGME